MQEGVARLNCKRVELLSGGELLAQATLQKERGRGVQVALGGCRDRCQTRIASDFVRVNLVGQEHRQGFL